MDGSIQAVRASATFASRWSGSFSVIICAAGLVGGLRPAPAGIINVWSSHGAEGERLRRAGGPHSHPTEPRSRPHLQERVAPASAVGFNRLICAEHTSQALWRPESVVRHSSADDALPAYCRKPMKKRLRGRFGVLPPGVLPDGTLRVADIVGTLEVANLDQPSPSRDHARAPPLQNHPA